MNTQTRARKRATDAHAQTDRENHTDLVVNAFTRLEAHLDIKAGIRLHITHCWGEGDEILQRFGHRYLHFGSVRRAVYQDTCLAVQAV